MTKTLFGAMAFIFLLYSSTLPAFSQNQTAYDGPGFEAYYPEESMLFLKGGIIPFLDRNSTTVTDSRRVALLSWTSLTLPTIVQAVPPNSEPFRFEGTLQSDFASLEATSNACAATNIPVVLWAQKLNSRSPYQWADRRMSNTPTDSIVMSKDRTDPRIFEATATDINISMNSVMRFQFNTGCHECAVSALLGALMIH